VDDPLIEKSLSLFTPLAALRQAVRHVYRIGG